MDDYLAKPFERRELVARVKAILRRSPTTPRMSKCRIGGLNIDRERREVLGLMRKTIPLTAGEFDLLGCFVDRPGRILATN